MKLRLEYIWLDNNGNCRSKTKILVIELFKELELSDIPIWNYDGSSTNQAITEDSEILLKPVKIIKDPFNRYIEDYISYLVLCEIYIKDNIPHPDNTRFNANELFNKHLEYEPMFGLEQEFFISTSKLKNNDIEVPVVNSLVNNLDNGSICYQEDYYCGIKGNNRLGKKYIDEILDNLLYSNLSITGMNAEVAPSQWEFQVCTTGISAADELILLRYICNRTLDKYNLFMDIRAKPMKGDWNGSGCHVNFSTKEMREENGYKKIEEAIERLSKKHILHIKHYGIDNNERLTGNHETSSIDKFSYGIGSRNTSIRIPNETYKNKKGYFEDRRPSSSLDPYIVTSLLFSTSIGI